MRFFAWDKSWLVILVCAALYLLNIYLSTGIYDASDGLAHFAISRYAPSHPKLFLDHWGKPLFTLLAAPFAQFGIKGVMVFNVVLYVVCARFLVLLFNRLNIPAGWLAPLLLALAPAWFQVTMGGLTEPLFATLLVGGLYFFSIKNFRAAALIIAWLPFARSEAVFILPLFALAFLALKQWRPLVLLASASVFMSLLGWFLLGDLLWILHDNPYVGAKEIYGSGSLWHFWDSMFLVTGTQVWYLSLFGLLLFLVKGWREQHRLTLLLAAMSLVLVFTGHSWFWYKGLLGSFGLLRVLATVMPLFVLFAFYGASRMFKNLPTPIISGVMLAVAIHLQGVLFYFQPMAKQPDAAEQCVQKMGEWYKSSAFANNPNVWYMHPAVGYYLGIDNFRLYDSRQLWNLNPLTPSLNLREGGLIVYDGLHSPNEGKTDKKMLFADENLHHIKTFRPAESANQNPFELLVFEKRSDANSDTLALENMTKNRPLLKDRLKRLGTDENGRPYFAMITFSHYQPIYTFWLADSAVWQAKAFNFILDAEPGVEVVLGKQFADGRVLDKRIAAGNFVLPEWEAGLVAITLGVRNPTPETAKKLYGFSLVKVR